MSPESVTSQSPSKQPPADLPESPNATFPKEEPQNSFIANLGLYTIHPGFSFLQASQFYSRFYPSILYPPLGPGQLGPLSQFSVPTDTNTSLGERSSTPESLVYKGPRKDDCRSSSSSSRSPSPVQQGMKRKLNQDQDTPIDLTTKRSRISLEMSGNPVEPRNKSLVLGKNEPVQVEKVELTDNLLRVSDTQVDRKRKLLPESEDPAGARAKLLKLSEAQDEKSELSESPAARSRNYPEIIETEMDTSRNLLQITENSVDSTKNLLQILPIKGILPVNLSTKA